MAVLVTGGAGYIGSHMVWELVDANEDVVVLDKLSTGFKWAVADKAKLVVGDVGDADLVASIIREEAIEAVIHFAGSVVVPESVADPLGYYQNNTSNTRTLIETCIRQGVSRFIFSSTAAVYGAAGDAPIGEDAVPRPESPYGTSKLMSEWMLRDAAQAHDLSYVALRYFNVAGADPKGRTGQSTRGATHLIKVACEAAAGKRDFIEIYGIDWPTRDGTCVRDYIHVTDLVAAHKLALDHLRGGGASMVANCGYGRGYSVRQVLDCVAKVSGRDLDIRSAPRRPGDPVSIVAASERIRAEFGWAPSHDDLDTIVSSALEWERKLAGMNT